MLFDKEIIVTALSVLGFGIMAGLLLNTGLMALGYGIKSFIRLIHK